MLSTRLSAILLAVGLAACARTPAQRTPAPATTTATTSAGGMTMAVAPDTRQAIVLPPAHRDMMLAEMRGLLGAVNGVLRGIAARDTALMRASAASGGMAAMMAGERMDGMGMDRGMRHDSAGMAAMTAGERMGGMGMARGMRHDSAGAAGRGAMRGMGPMMPEAFRRLGHATHLAFDSLAARVSAGASTDEVVGRLAATTSNCVACHAAWRLEVAP